MPVNHEASAALATLNETLSALLTARVQLSASQEASADLQRRLDEANAKLRAAEAVPASVEPEDAPVPQNGTVSVAIGGVEIDVNKIAKEG